MSYAKSKEVVERLLRNEFDRLEEDFLTYEKSSELMQTAQDFGLHDLAEQMKNDLQ